MEDFECLSVLVFWCFSVLVFWLAFGRAFRRIFTCITIMRKQFGGRVSPALLKKYAQSPNWDGEKFVNLEETLMKVSFQHLPGLLYKRFCEKNEREPLTPLPVVPFDTESFLSPLEQARFLWYGHSVVLMRVHHQTILIDPMLGPDASPVAPFSTNRFSENTLDLIDTFPDIDLLLLTHDHYDHLDHDSIQKLRPKVKKYLVALGVARHLVKWGVPEHDITEFDWWDQHQVADLQFTFTPTRHFSGRGLSDRAKSLWGGWVIQSPKEKIYFSGDGGYGAHFKEVGRRLGPFDFAFMECGQYYELWRPIHLYPEESVQAAQEVNAACVMPVHWGGFSLAMHSWKEPVERFVAAARQAQLPVMTPRLGQLFTVGAEEHTKAWWAEL